MTKVAKDQGGLSQINNDDFHTCMFACFLSQEEPKREDDIDYKEVFALVTRIEAIRLFLAYASFMGFMVYQMDVKSDFLYGTIEEEVYVCQPPGFKDPNYPDKVHKVVKALYGLHQAPKACQDKYVAEILRKFGLTDGKLASTPIDTEKPLLKDPDGEDVDVHTYRSMIGSLMYLTSSRPNIMFAVSACARFQVTPKALHLHAVKRIFGYLKGKPHLSLWYPKDSPFNLVAYSDSDCAGASLDWKSTTGGCQFLGCQLISWQCKKQIVVATSSTKADYVAAASCCAQVLWIQNQLLDYGLIVTAVSSQFLLFDASKGFDQIIDFLNASSIKYALTVNPNIYVSCIKQFWTSILVKKSIDCLPNEEIFTELSRMGYEKPSTKLTFYKAFFSPQWKFLIHTILQCMSAKRTSWNKFISSMASAVICLSTGRKFNFSKYIFGSLNSSPALTQKVFANMRRPGKGFSKVDTPMLEGMIVAQQDDDVANEGAASVFVDDVLAAADEPTIPSPTPTTPPPPPSQDPPSTSQVQPTPPPSPIVQAPSTQQQPPPSQDAEISMDLLHTLLETCITLTRRSKHLEQDKISQAPEIAKLKQRVKKLETTNKLKMSKLRRLKKVGTSQRFSISNDTVMDDISKQGRIIASMDADVDVTLKDVADIAKEVVVDAEIEEMSDVQGRQTESQAQIYQIDLEHTDKVLSMQNGELEPVELQEVVEVVTTAKLMTEVVTAASATITVVDTANPVALTFTTAPSAARRRKGVVIRDPEETATPSTIIHTEPKSKDKGKGILVEEPKPLKKKEKEDNAVMRYQALKRKPQTEAQAINNKMIYLRNMAGFKMDYFKGMKYDDIQKVAKKQKLDQEVAELKRHLQIVPNDEDDIYTEATPLARKVPIVEYEIYIENNKPYYKIIRADGSPRLFLSFLSLLMNFDREDLQVLWQLVKERFAYFKPKNFSDDFLLTTLTHMFEKPDVQAQMILLVDRRHLLTRFTLDQMLNNVILDVEEESEVSLELLRFVRQQQQEGFRPE
uniref:Uncharacterized mitochondrial protein AtMg00810-like n=1 Tax=Tanacetum cinerariifolium TaxID=118510 RepID=A0A699HCE2_TANCI|nr:uncharacterized mitochondrial protein AtMg00810-like [Tanacetum cinerariifolium]